MQTGAEPTGLVPGERVQGHPAVRTLLLSRGELSAWLLDQRTAAAQQLNDSAAAVWALLDRPCTVDELTAELVEMTGLEPEPAREIVVAALDTFRDADLLDDAGGDDGDGAEGDDGDAAEGGGDGDDQTGGDHSTGGENSPDRSADVEVPQRLARPPDP